ncbi:YcxB family protein [Streptomyces sp. NPDC006733]|uniref:YcxB family protein n=1 Tax=Streptomyces sp. NPDC006733 TaxID=3155460 RepID=UPI0033EA6BD7
MDTAPTTETGSTPVVLDFTLTAADYAGALRTRRRITPQGRFVRISAVIMLAGSLLLLLLWALGTMAFPLQAVGTAALLCAVLHFQPELTGRAMVKATKGAGETQVTVDDAGLLTVTQAASGTVFWQRFGRYVESETAFVLLSPDRNGTCLSILPKRALTTVADTDRLRALLDSHLERR